MKQSIAILPGPCLLPAREFDEKKVWLWFISLEASCTEVIDYRSILSTEERDRVARYRFEGDRRRSTVARGVLRVILGACLGREPGSLRFQRGLAGKPELEAAPGDPTITFNTSHSGDQVLIGVAVGRRIGVDVERIQEHVDIDAIAARFFAPEEAAAIREMPAEARGAAFHAYWTAKEAYLKALGLGLPGGLDSFTVKPCTQGWRLLPRRSTDNEPPGIWTIRSLNLAYGYAAAVAVEGASAELEITSFASPAATAVGFRWESPSHIVTN